MEESTASQGRVDAIVESVAGLDVHYGASVVEAASRFVYVPKYQELSGVIGG